MTHVETLLVAAIIVLVYSFASIRFSRAAQPLRARVLKDISALCRDPNIPDDVKADLQVLSENLFSKMNGWLIVALFPVVIVKNIFRGVSGRTRPRLTGDLRSRVTQTIGMGLFCMIATSPICTVIFAIEFIVSLIIAGPWGWIRSLMRTVASVDETVASISIFAK